MTTIPLHDVPDDAHAAGNAKDVNVRDDVRLFKHDDHDQKVPRFRAWAAKHSDDNGVVGELTFSKEYHLSIGFYRIAPEGIRRFALPATEAHSIAFRAQDGQERRKRFDGGGLTEPPHGEERRYGGDYLDESNMRWQQRGLELSLDLSRYGVDRLVVPNPFPLGCDHWIAVAKEYRAQDIFMGSPDDMLRRLERILGDMLTLGSLLPGSVVGYNGKDAGASSRIEHVHTLARPNGWPVYPLEEVAWATLRQRGTTPFLVGGYPLPVVFFRGGREKILEDATRVISEWVKSTTHPHGLSCNLIVTARGHGDSPTFDLYFVPRVKGRALSALLTGEIGFLECLGEFVLTTEEEIRLLRQSQFTSKLAAHVLSAVAPSRAQEHLATILAEPSESPVQCRLAR